jgi:Tfp pilus assembly PilM family ATPase
VVVSVFPKEIIKTITALYKKVGIRPISFLSESTALTSSVVINGDLEPYLILRILNKKIDVAVVEDGVVQYTSDIGVGADCFAKKDQDKLNSLKEELNRILIFWFTNNDQHVEHKKINNVLISGLMADDASVRDFFSKHLNINVATANVWINCFDLKKYLPRVKKESALNCGVAIGLAIKSIEHA